MFARSLLASVTRNALYQKSRCNFAVIRRFSKEHEWVEYDSEAKTGLVGITSHAASELGDIVHIEFPDLGMSFSAGQSIGSIESVKVAADLYAPIDGSIEQINEPVSEDPSLVNVDPNLNWFLKVKVTNPAQIESLFTKEQYDEFLKNTSH